MTEKPIIEGSRVSRLNVTVQLVFRANFNDTYYLEEVTLPLDSFNRETLTWFDPYHGRSKRNDTLVALAQCSDEGFLLLERQGDRLREHRVSGDSVCILCEDNDESTLLASHIQLR